MTSLPSAVPRVNGLFNAILTKPFTPDVLLRTLAGCLGADAPEPGDNEVSAG